MRFLGRLIMLIVVLIIAIGIWVWSGVYNVAADVPHWTATRYVIGQVREHSIDSRINDIKVPANLDSPAMLSEGAHHYAEMCTGCHLAPGMGESELRTGLYPKPPNLTHFAPDPAEAFWVIKHGIKMTAMPAWGKTHDDQKIWAMVAYLQKQPHMGVERYRQLAGMNESMPGPHTHHDGHEMTPDLRMDHDGNESMPANSATAAAPAMTVTPTTAASADTVEAPAEAASSN